MHKKNIILLDEKGREIGFGEKIKVHKEGRFHKAFSVFVFNSKGEMLLQKRANSKYHSGGLWSNACCSHPRPKRIVKKEAEKRLGEEMGIKCNLKEIFNFIYKAKVGDLTEHEFDHVFIGTCDDNPHINKKEVEDWKWIEPKKLKKDINENPMHYTPWFRLILNKIVKIKKI